MGKQVTSNPHPQYLEIGGGGGGGICIYITDHLKTCRYGEYKSMLSNHRQVYQPFLWTRVC